LISALIKFAISMSARPPWLICSSPMVFISALAVIVSCCRVRSG
jgi:hypothetical protein